MVSASRPSKPHDTEVTGSRVKKMSLFEPAPAGIVTGKGLQCYSGAFGRCAFSDAFRCSRPDKYTQHDCSRKFFTRRNPLLNTAGYKQLPYLFSRSPDLQEYLDYAMSNKVSRRATKITTAVLARRNVLTEGRNTMHLSELY